MTLNERLYCMYIKKKDEILIVSILYKIIESMAIVFYVNFFLAQRIFVDWMVTIKRMSKKHTFNDTVDLFFLFFFSRDLIKDGMLLYRHSARCSKAMQWFLDCNPTFWNFVPMVKEKAHQDNQSYVLPSSIPLDPTSTIVTKQNERSDSETGLSLIDLPPLPSDDYTFSTRQCAQQFALFKEMKNRLQPNNDLDLYNASIVAVRK